MPGQGHRACRFAFLRWMCHDCFHNRKTRTNRQSGIACPKWEAAGFGHIVWMQASPVRRTTTGVSIRLLAKLGIAPRSGRGGRGFESRKANVVGDNDCMRSCNHAGVAQRQSGFLVRNRSRFRNSSSALIQAFICNPYRYWPHSSVGQSAALSRRRSPAQARLWSPCSACISPPSYNGQYIGFSSREHGFDSRWRYCGDASI